MNGVEMKGITKTFGHVIANQKIDFDLKYGEIHALLGENGAGKSTLMNILYGLYRPDSGNIFIHDQKCDFRSPFDAIRAGIGMVHQHFMLVPVLTVTENVMLGMESIRNGMVLDRTKASKRIREISDQYGLEVDPEATVEDLPVGIQQRVEIIKLLYRNADILILDEPTAVLTPQEVTGLIRVVRSLVAQGKSVVFISHKLKEVLELSDRIVVLRRGRSVGSTTPEESDERSLASMMVGRDVILEVPKGPAHPGDVVLDVQDLVVKGDQEKVAVSGISFQVRGGEIVGAAGVQGNGQTELVEAITGLRPVESGRVMIGGHDVTNASPRAITEFGTAHVPEDRQRDGLVLSYSVAHNVILNTYYVPPFARGPLMQETAVARQADQLIAQFDVRTPSPQTPVANLSGGNQQKVIVARELSRPVQLTLASQPTRGLDVGSIEYIHAQLVKKRDEGAAVLVVSAELDEVMALADRILVMYEGRIMGTLDATEATRERLGLLMAGVATA